MTEEKRKIDNGQQTWSTKWPTLLGCAGCNEHRPFGKNCRVCKKSRVYIILSKWNKVKVAKCYVPLCMRKDR